MNIAPVCTYCKHSLDAEARGLVCSKCWYAFVRIRPTAEELLNRPPNPKLEIVINKSGTLPLPQVDEQLIGPIEPLWWPFRCVDCGFWLSFYHCRICGKRLCGTCVDWPGSRLHSPGKGMCSTCRESESERLKDAFPLHYESPVIHQANPQPCYETPSIDYPQESEAS